MTLKDLYDSIDWSESEEAYLKWAKGKEVADEDIPEFKAAWRTSLLMSALPKEMLPEKIQKDWTLERQQEARWMLNAAGAWPQVVKFLRANDMIGDSDAEAVG